MIILGLALLLGAGAFWLDTLTSDEPASLGTTIRDWLTLLAGLGASIKGWLDLFKKVKPAPPATHIEVSGGNPQIATGGNAHNVQTGSGDYLERGDKIEVHLPPPPEPRDSIGYIPPVKAVTYIHRGAIEDEVRAFLRSGNGAGAIVGLHAPGGLGKTELAKHVADEMKDQFDGLLWVDVGEKTPPQVTADMLIKCGVQTRPGDSYEQQKTELRHHLSTRRLLVILDDLRQNALGGLEDFLPPKPCAALLISRIQQIGGVNKDFALDHLTPEQARELEEAVLGVEVVAAEAGTALKLAERCAFNPLALEIAARRIRQLEGIKKPGACYFEIAQARFSELAMDGDARWAMTRIFDISYADLSAAEQQRFRALAAFHPTGFAPEAAAFV